ncbi:Hypothetical protein A7982_09227 [Minicystis rosea]|nr:Hypothetical protein A7982_09227 [Minicystis rosea]
MLAAPAACASCSPREQRARVPSRVVVRSVMPDGAPSLAHA